VNWVKMGYSLIGKPSMYVHTYMIDGLLIDTGISKLRKEFIEEIQQHKIEQIVISHHHEDHTGNLSELQSALQLEAKAHPLTIDLVSRPKSISLARHMSWGCITPTTCGILDLVVPIETNHYNFEIHHIPGHAVDQIALYEKSQGWLFSADLYLTSYPKIFMDNESILTSIKSLDSMLVLDFDVLFCCHRPRYENGKSFLQEKKQYLEEFYGKVIREYQEGNEPRQILKALGLKEHHQIKLLSQQEISSINMVRSCIRDYNTISR